MLLNNRIIWKDNATLRDVSVTLNDWHTGAQTMDIVAAQDAIYIGSDLPFNHRYFDIHATNKNANAATVAVSLWNGTSFVPAVDVVDQTSVSGATLAQSGIISWVPDRAEVWNKEASTEDIADLSTLKIYNFYWAKLTFSADLTNTTQVKYVGHKFSTDADLKASGYPELLLTSALRQFANGDTSKTNWTEQHIAAAEFIVKDLRKKKVIWSRNQIVDWEQLFEPAVHKCAEIIYTSQGEDSEEKRARAETKYLDSMTLDNIFNVDKDEDARLDRHEKEDRGGIFRV